MTTWLNDQDRLQALRDEIAKLKSNYDLLHESWLSRGRELNDLYDEIASIVHPYSTRDPLTDLALIGVELRALRECVEELSL